MSELEHEQPIRKLESSTIRAAVRNFVIQLIAMYSMFSGNIIEIEQADKYAGWAAFAAIILYNAWETRNIIKGRATATEKVDVSLPWKKEIKETKIVKSLTGVFK